MVRGVHSGSRPGVHASVGKETKRDAQGKREGNEGRVGGGEQEKHNFYELKIQKQCA